MSTEPFETAQAQGVPTVRQQSIFVENRVGQLLRLTRLFEGTEIRILGLSVVYSVDCAVCRMVVDDPDAGYELMKPAGFQVSETELLVVSLPHGRRALHQTLAALLGGEVSIHYIYPLLVRHQGSALIALCPDDLEGAARVLQDQDFQLLDQADLYQTRYD